MSEVAIVTGAITVIDLLDRLVAVWQLRQQAAADLAAATNAQAAAEAKARMDAAHAETMLLHERIQAIKTGTNT